MKDLFKSFAEELELRKARDPFTDFPSKQAPSAKDKKAEEITDKMRERSGRQGKLESDVKAGKKPKAIPRLKPEYAMNHKEMISHQAEQRATIDHYGHGDSRMKNKDHAELYNQHKKRLESMSEEDVAAEHYHYNNDNYEGH
jgi:hypothetical protein